MGTHLFGSPCIYQNRNQSRFASLRNKKKLFQIISLRLLKLLAGWGVPSRYGRFMLKLWLCTTKASDSGTYCCINQCVHMTSERTAVHSWARW